MEFDHEIFSAVILSLPWIKEGRELVSGERMSVILHSNTPARVVPYLSLHF